MQSSLILLSILAIFASYCVQILLSRWRQSATARRLGCQPVSKYPHTLPYGIDLYRKRVKARQSGQRNAYDLQLFQSCGRTYMENSLNGPVICTSDPKNFQAVGATQFDQFVKEGRDGIRRLFGRGILSLNGSGWRQARNVVTPLFKRAELSDMGRFEKYVDRMLLQIPRDGATVDMQPLLQKLFLDSSTEFVFGESLDSLRDTSGQADDLLNALNQALAGAGRRLNPGPSFAFLFKYDKKWIGDIEKVHSFIDTQIARYRKGRVNEAASSNDNTDAKPRPYVLLDGMSKEVDDPVELRFQLFNVFFPARDTSAIAVSNTLFYLARDPKLWAELREQALGLQNQSLTFELLKGLSDFRYALFEAIRMQGPSGQVRRIAACDTTLPRGGGRDGSFPVFVAKGTAVYLNNFPIMRDEDIWGEDVETYRPSRFKGRTLNWEFTPFFGGPRICPAVNMVVVQSVYLLVRLVAEFGSIENRDPCYEYVQRARMLVESGNGVQVALHPGQ